MVRRAFSALPSGLLSGLIAALVAVPLGLVTSSGVAHAENGLAVTSTTTYAIDADSGVVHVVVEMSLRNTIPDEVKDGYTTQHYFSAFSLPAPVGATNPAAVSGGGSLTVTAVIVPNNSDFFVYEISFASRLLFGQTTQITFTYDITGHPPRSENPSRVNSAYAAFQAFGIGDDGQVTVRVLVPPGFTSDTLGDDATITNEDGNTVYTAANIDNPDEFGIFVSARKDEALIESRVTTSSGAEFLVRSWPGDTEWQQFVTAQIEAGVPVLSDLIGQPWPIDEEVEVREAYTPYLYGYAGWFSASRNELEIGENLDADVVMHELSHAWFNNGWFTERWLSEGFAQLYADNTVAVLGGNHVDPDAIDDTDPGRVALNAWGDPNFAPSSDEADAIEKYGYNASFSIVQQVADEIGDDRMRTVLDAVAHDTTAYRGDGPAETFANDTDWRRFLDLVEEIGGAELAVAWIQQYVATPDQQASIAQRTESRTSYQELVNDGGQWAPPVVVRENMAAWEFLIAEELIEAARDVLTMRDELDEKAAQVGAHYPDALEALYEDSEEHLDESSAAVQQQIDTADAVLAAIDAEGDDDGFFGEIGLVGSDLAEALDDARLAFANGDHELARDLAQDVIESVDNAPNVGKQRTMFVVGGILLATAIAITLGMQRRRVRGLKALSEEV